MGLDMSHDAWRSSYGGFMEFRRLIAKLAGISLDEMAGFTDGEGKSWDAFAHDPIVHLLNHSDCDGELAVEVLTPLADRLEELASQLPKITAGYDWVPHAERLIAGLRRAAELGEPVEFR